MKSQHLHQVEVTESAYLMLGRAYVYVAGREPSSLERVRYDAKYVLG